MESFGGQLCRQKSWYDGQSPELRSCFPLSTGHPYGKGKCDSSDICESRSLAKRSTEFQGVGYICCKIDLTLIDKSTQNG